MAFTGWKVEALEFFEGLEAENTKAYWTANKDVYDTIVRAPMEELLAELEPAYGEGKIFRPYRDVRFSADKTPYKTHIGATVGDGYVQLSAEGLAAGSGMWHMEADQLQRYREAVAGDKTGRALEEVVETAAGKGVEISGHDALRTAPKGYDKDHPRIELLRYKGIVTWRSWQPAAWLGTRKAKDRLVEFLDASEPLNVWLGANVGPSELPPRER